jgi:hypothetical protein
VKPFSGLGMYSPDHRFLVHASSSCQSLLVKEPTRFVQGILADGSISPVHGQ